MHRFDVLNPSILLGEQSFAEQLDITARRGFSAVELWWPFPDAAPSLREQDAVLSALDASALSLVSLNLYEGGMAAGHRGLVCRAESARDLDSSYRVARRMLEKTGCPNLNVLHGNLDDAQAEGVQRDRAARRTAEIADDLADLGVTVLIEQLSNVDAYGITSVAELRAAVDGARSFATRGSIAIQFDFFHLARTGEDLTALLSDLIEDIGHIQVADMPDRGGPGSGDLPLTELLGHIESLGYDGRVALEYSHFVHEPFEWMSGWYGS